MDELKCPKIYPHSDEVFSAFYVRGCFEWDGDNLYHTIFRQIGNETDREVLCHYKTDFHELREFLEAKRRGQTLRPVVTCGECIHRHNPRKGMCIGRGPDFFCAAGKTEG